MTSSLAGRADWHQLGDRAKCASQIGGSRTSQRAVGHRLGERRSALNRTLGGQAATSVGVERRTTGGRRASKPPNDRQTALSGKLPTHTGYSRKPHGRQLDRVRETAGGMPTELAGQHCLSDRTKSGRHPVGHQPNWRQSDHANPGLAGTWSGTSRTNPPLAGETLDELHGLVNYFGIAFAYAFGYARFQMVAQQHF